jgi:hypothetical protein
MVLVKKFNPNERILKQAYAFPDDDELRVAEILARITGEKVLFLAPNRVKNYRTPDIKIGKMLWEIKIPKGKGKYTLAHAFKSAVGQSENLAFYLINWKLPEKKAIDRLEKEFKMSRAAKRMKIILKSEKVLDFEK